MKRFISIVCVLTASVVMSAQHAIGSWQSFQSYHNATKVAVSGNTVYTLANGGLYSYDKDDNSLRCYYKDAPLSDTDITTIAYNKNNNSMIIVYADFNIDIMNGDDVYNMPEYMNKNISQDKTVNDISFDSDKAYLSTNFGIVVIDMKRKEVLTSYILNTKVNSSAVINGNIYAATQNGLSTASLINNPLDVNNWRTISEKVFRCLSIYKGEITGAIANDGIYLINSVENSFKQIIAGDYTFMNSCDDKLIVSNGDAIAIFSDIDKFQYMLPFMNIADVTCDKGIYWMAQHEKGLNGWNLTEDNTFTPIVEDITPDSPKRNLFYTIKFHNSKLLATGGGIEANRFYRRGTAMTMENGKWTNFQEDGISEITGVPYMDITSIAEDPTDDRRHMLSSAGEGVYEFYDGKFVKLYSTENSSLESAIKGDKSYVRTNGLIYDKAGNMWVVNTGRDVVNNLHLLTADGQWKTLNYSELNDKTNLSKTIIDKRGWLWVISTWQLDNGVFCLDTNGTPEDNSDDRHRFIGSLTNQDGAVLTHKGIFCITEDKDGAIWIGTGHGPLILKNPSGFFENGFTCTQVKVPRNDGTNLADYLLVNDRINDIAVDGGNRKWVATESNGIYLLSSDGIETIQHFTTDNSPLPSDCVTSIAIDNSDGTVYIGTQSGLVAYQSEATDGASEFNKENVYAYPNPVRPDYNGYVTITGLKSDSNVKITNAAGRVVNEGTSVGGQFLWNCKTASGDRVTSGIYFVLATDEDGNDGIVTKIMIIR